MAGSPLRLDPISRLLLDFKGAWRKGPPRVEAFLAKLHDEDRAYGLSELVRVDINERYRRGQCPS